MNGNGKKAEVNILMAEDDDGHAHLILERLSEAGIENQVTRFMDGKKAWEFLSMTGAGEKREPGKPYLLLLDIKMPRMDGMELLEKIKADPALKSLPVIMLTTNEDSDDIRKCYALGCNNYLTKPVAFDKFSQVIKRLGLFLMVMKVSGLD